MNNRRRSNKILDLISNTQKGPLKRRYEKRKIDAYL